MHQWLTVTSYEKQHIGQPLFMRFVVVGIWVVDATQVPSSIIRIILIKYTVNTYKLYFIYALVWKIMLFTYDGLHLLRLIFIALNQ